MKPKNLNALLICKQIEDDLVPRLRLNLVERVVYYHLLRHTRLEGKLQLRFSILWLTRGIRLSAAPARQAVRTLVEKGALRLLERTRAGHVVDVLLPGEIRAQSPDGPVPSCLARRPRTASLEEADFLLTKTRRAAIHVRDGGLCFYCLTELTPRTRCLDHVIGWLAGAKIPTAISSPAAPNATRRKEKPPPTIFCALSAASAA